jgi:hypothetical protein
LSAVVLGDLNYRLAAPPEEVLTLVAEALGREKRGEPAGERMT